MQPRTDEPAGAEEKQPAVKPAKRREMYCNNEHDVRERAVQQCTRETVEAEEHHRQRITIEFRILKWSSSLHTPSLRAQGGLWTESDLENKLWLPRELPKSSTVLTALSLHETQDTPAAVSDI